MQGTVLKFDRVTAYGFVLPDNPELPDHFVLIKWMASGQQKVLLPGWRVEFDSVYDDNSRPQARNVRIISKPIAAQHSAPQNGGAL